MSFEPAAPLKVFKVKILKFKVFYKFIEFVYWNLQIIGNYSGHTAWSYFLALRTPDAQIISRQVQCSGRLPF